MCPHPIDPMGIHLLHYAHGNEHTRTYVVRNTFAAIMRNAGFHMGWKQLHAFFTTTHNSFCQQIDIVVTKDGIHTLTNVVIINPTHVNLFFQSCTIQGFTTSNATQVREKSYHDQHTTNQFLLLTIEILGCLHKQVNVFLHDCANVIWSLKGLESFPLLS